MDSPAGAADLGHGVTVRLEEGGLRIESQSLELGWTTGGGHLPGTAVVWQGDPWEVAEALPMAAGQAFRLTPWPDGAAMRTVVRLDAAAVAGIAAAAARDGHSRRRRRILTVLAPLAALAPAVVQTRWRLEHGYPAVAATYLSALLEIALGSLGVLQLFASVGGGGAFLLPRGLLWLGPVGPFLLGEGLVRLVLSMSHHQPVGSLVGLPLLLFEPRAAPPSSSQRPRLVHLEQDRLELASPVLRRDWEAEDGVLAYRDRLFRLVAAARGEGGWHYRFREVDAEPAGGRRLRLEPPAPAAGPAPEAGQEAPGLSLRFVLEAPLMSLAPGRLQRAWADRRGVSPAALAGLSAAAELLGGLVNLRHDAGGAAGWLLLDALLLAEGGLRLVAMLLRSGPVGSVLGLPLLPLLRRWAAPDR